MRFRHLLPIALASVVLASIASAQDLYDRNVLRTIDLQFSQPDWEDQLKNNKAAGLEEYIPCDMTVEGVLYPNVGVRYKGNSSYWIATNGQKRPMSIDLNAFGVDQEIMGRSKLVLNNQWSDSSLMREIMAYRILGEVMPAPGANFVKVLINGDNYGIYTSVEHLGGDFCRDRFGSDDGFRYKAVPPDQWPDTLTPPPPPGDLALQDILQNMVRAERAYELKNREMDPLHHVELLNAIEVLNNTSSDFLLAELNPLFDTDQAIRYLAANNAVVSLDAYYNSGRNYYLVEHPRHHQLQILPWDYNMAFGGYQGGNDLSPTAGKGDANRPLLPNLVKGTVLRQEYLAHIREINARWMDPAILNPEIDALEALIDAEVQADTRLALSYNGWKSGVSQLKNFISNRHNYLNTHSLIDVEVPNYVAYGLSNSAPTSNDSVLVWAQVENANDPVEAVHVHYRAQGAFIALQMLDDGLSGDGAAGDGIYAATIPAQTGGSTVEYFLHAECTNSNAVSYEPYSSSHEPMSYFVSPTVSDSDVVINEFVASNQTGPVDEMGEHEDWLELHNHGTSTLDLSGMWLSDELEDPMKWQIPAGTTLAPDQFLLIWADGEELDGPLHTNFKLSSAGEDLTLFDVDGTTMRDFLRFGPQQADIATGRMFEGDNMWVTLTQTTPSASNEISCGAREYQALDPGNNSAELELIGTPNVGAQVDLMLASFLPSSVVQLQIGTQAVSQGHEASGLTGLVDGLLQQIPVSIDATGNATVPFDIPSNPLLAGTRVYLQAGILGPNAIASHGLEVVICP